MTTGSVNTSHYANSAQCLQPQDEQSTQITQSTNQGNNTQKGAVVCSNTIPIPDHHYSNQNALMPPGAKYQLKEYYKQTGITLPCELTRLPDGLEQSLQKIPNSAYSKIKRYLEIEKHLPLKAQCKTRFTEVANPKGLVILFHGFSAGTWQFDEWQQQYLDNGYNVLVPRLIGHGFVDANDSTADDLSHLPVADRAFAWNDFCNRIYDMAAEGGLPIHVAGISGGGTCAAYLASNHNVQSAFLMAPYFIVPRRDAKALMKAETILGYLTLLQSNRLLNRITVPLRRPPEQDQHDRVYKKITLGSEMCLRQFGSSVLRNLTNIRTPGKLVTSESDIAADQKPIERLWASFDNQVKHTRFSADLDVPHTMMNTFEYDNPEIVNQVKQEALGLAEEFNSRALPIELNRPVETEDDVVNTDNTNSLWCHCIELCV